MILFYDFEVFAYDWLVVFEEEHGTTVIVNDVEKLRKYYEQHKNYFWIGYNSNHYDRWILKAILDGYNPKLMNDHIIKYKKSPYEFDRSLNRKYNIISYDARFKKTMKSLKYYEASIGMDIRETTVDFDIDRPLTEEEIDKTIFYCTHDVKALMEIWSCGSKYLKFPAEFVGHIQLINMVGGNYVDCMPLSNAKLSARLLEAKQVQRDDDWDIEIPDNLILNEYQEVKDWFLDPKNQHYKIAKYKQNGERAKNDVTPSLELDIFGVPHKFGLGGLHGAIKNYVSRGRIFHIDVSSYYPHIMKLYKKLSRSMKDPNKFVQFMAQRLQYKAEGNPLNQPLKIMINIVYGAMKDKNNDLLDRKHANEVCILGQLFLLDLLEKIHPYCKIIQSNTDGIIVEVTGVNLDRNERKMIEKVHEWEKRTGFEMEIDKINLIVQKDVNNYMCQFENGDIETTGSWFNEFDPLNAVDMPILATALREYYLNNTLPEITINNCNDLIMYQKIFKTSEKKPKITKNGKEIKDNVIRGFVTYSGDTYKYLNQNGDEETCSKDMEGKTYIDNSDIREKGVEKIDKQWYINKVYERIGKINETRY